MDNNQNNTAIYQPDNIGEIILYQLCIIGLLLTAVFPKKQELYFGTIIVAQKH
jgi:hypothetical protein